MSFVYRHRWILLLVLGKGDHTGYSVTFVAQSHGKSITLPSSQPLSSLSCSLLSPPSSASHQSCSSRPLLLLRYADKRTREVEGTAGSGFREAKPVANQVTGWILTIVSGSVPYAAKLCSGLYHHKVGNGRLYAEFWVIYYILLCS